MRAFVALSALLLTGCQTTSSAPEAAQTLPVNHRLMIVERVKDAFFDPYSIRDAAISAPIPGVSFQGHILTVCVLANAKNRMGGYTGRKPTAFVFRDGAITAAIGHDQYATAELACSDAKYSPFPEIEAKRG